VYSDQICESCFNSARDLATFRQKLLDNQKKLEEAFKELEDEAPKQLEINDPPEIPFILTQSESEEVTVKVEQMSDDEDRFSLNKFDENEVVKTEELDSDEEMNNFEFMRE
jgi:flagellar motility protein MotE (MotC chaperone)